jgi:hypothetical protein
MLCLDAEWRNAECRDVESHSSNEIADIRHLCGGRFSPGLLVEVLDLVAHLESIDLVAGRSHIPAAVKLLDVHGVLGDNVIKLFTAVIYERAK